MRVRNSSHLWFSVSGVRNVVRAGLLYTGNGSKGVTKNASISLLVTKSYLPSEKCFLGTQCVLSDVTFDLRPLLTIYTSSASTCIYHSIALV